ncbi:alpha/beta fold hydrolase [Actinoallomurus rhizosphaericola]|uniref:alpha/beta fold hydrolase n=1 Tax=Actinoallomurus rhizosphaericola TaxID=2952536 RepID=UPI0020937B9B|nr:alpha/beta hydrolase [Actinoallomurus rhizosphaericola]MCO5999846.1 alpha/beta hydrolase [Actinoallomurus rhizosphaericola]
MMQGLHHNMFDRADVRIHYVTAGTPPSGGGDGRTIVLLHGWPQTWWEWRLVMEPLRSDGWFVVAPDYRGAGGSSKPEGGYDKQTMAGDVRALLDHLGVQRPITLVGHDLGMLVAYAYASLYPDDVERLVLMEAPIPGTEAYESVLATTRFSEAKLWHFHFHGAPGNIAETLIAGSEFPYLRSFYVKLSANPDAISIADAERYVADYTAPGAMRAGLELFRAFEKDADDNRRILAEKGKLKMPVLGLGGTASFFLPVAEEMLSEVAESVSVRPIEDSGHWIAEEQPATLLQRLREFVQTAGAG